MGDYFGHIRSKLAQGREFGASTLERDHVALYLAQQARGGSVEVSCAAIAQDQIEFRGLNGPHPIAYVHASLFAQVREQAGTVSRHSAPMGALVAYLATKL